MVTKTLSNKRNNRYIWERGNIVVGPINIGVRKHSKGKSERERLEIEREREDFYSL